jgi:integrase
MNTSHTTPKLDSSTPAATNYVAERTQIVDIPNSKFTFPNRDENFAGGEKSGDSRTSVPGDSNYVAGETVSKNVARSEPALTDLADELYDVTEMGIFRRRRDSNYLTAGGVPECCPFAAASYSDDLAEAVCHTQEAIEFYLHHLANRRKRSRGIIEQARRHLRDLFALEIYPDPVLELLRPLTLPELLQRDGGRLLFFHLQDQFDDLGLGDVGNDKLAVLRKFSRFIAETALLPSGTNLRKRWGPVLVAPIQDGEIERRKTRTKAQVPPIEMMPLIYEAIYEWEQLPGRRSASAPTTACLTRTAFGSGARGAELRNATLKEQLFERQHGPMALPAWLLLPSAKSDDYRRANLDPFGHAQLQYYLAKHRPLISGDPLGVLFPNEQGTELSASSLSSNTKSLLDYLKECGLIDRGFTFHATRKTFATQFVERGGNLRALMDQCGWKNTSQLSVYLCASQSMKGRQQTAWERTLKPGRAA